MTIPSTIREVYAKATCLFSQDDINQALDRMAAEIHDKLSEENPILLSVMVGALIPAGHLLTRLDFPLELDYIHATRYQGKIRGSELVWKVEPRTNMQGRTIIVLDDILDQGVTLAAIVDYCKAKGAKAVYTAVMVDKEHARIEDGLAHADFVGLKVDNHYVFGFGLDYKEYLRNAPGIYRVAPEHEK